jgi:carbonic anhydrase/acetyltransferase-like protein (isoleucine patch superfamily)
MAIFQLGADAPQIDTTAYIADSAAVIGKVSVGAQSSVWFNVTIRGDNEPITIGAGTNVQEGSAMHTDMGFPLVVGDNVTIGHQAMLHGCTIGDGALIGIQAVVMNGAVIGKGCLVGAGSVVTEGKVFPDHSLIVGAPARAIRVLSEEQQQGLRLNAASYIERGQLFKTQLKKIG